MKPTDPNEQGVFSTGTRISDSESWFKSILRQFRERREDRNAPPPEITASRDPSALNNLIQNPSSIASLFEGVKARFSDWRHPRQIEMSATPVEVEELWSKDNSGYSGLISLAVHVVIVGVLLIPAAMIKPPAPTETMVQLVAPSKLIFNLAPDPRKAGGGGGGGMKTPTPPSKGVPPRGADKQFVPPMVEAKNLHPELIMEMTTVAPQLQNLPQVSILQIGDPNGVAGPPSAGPGSGGGIGTGTGRGVGEGRGPGVGDGEGGGTGGGVFAIGNGISNPQIISDPRPDYSDDARKARAQGTVVLAIIVRKDGTVSVQEVTKKLGFGLDQKAIDAVKRWKFIPAKKDGNPVDVFVSVEVNFTLR